MLTPCYFSGGGVFSWTASLCQWALQLRQQHKCNGSPSRLFKPNEGGYLRTGRLGGVGGHSPPPHLPHFPFHYVLELCFRQVACGSGLGRWLWRGFSPHGGMCDKLSWQGCHSNVSSSLEEVGEIHLSFDQFSGAFQGFQRVPSPPLLPTPTTNFS